VTASALDASSRAELCAAAATIADEAAALVLGGYRTRPTVDRKGRSDLVTEFDRASEALITERLGALTPSIPVVGEEESFAHGDPTARRSRGRGGLSWYVDPIDGTTNFVHGHPFWCVAIGLMEEDQPILGAVVAPSIGVRWTGWLGPGGGAMRNGESCRVSGTASLPDALIATGFPPVRDDTVASNFASFIAVKRAAQAVRRCGSAAMDLCLVGDGTYDGYWERRLHVWDCAAASAIVLAAGGTITALDGGPADYHKGHIVASNGLLHDALLDAIAGR
jgi:myo-inositol-1(or 4)-monophosphatase